MEPKQHPANQRWFSLPAHFEQEIEALLAELGYSLSQAAKLADAVLRLSDLYMEQPLAATPWQERWAKIAYLSYFFPLNYARASAVAQEATRLGFFEGLEHLFDFGSGTGSALYAFGEQFKAETIVAMDSDQIALDYSLCLRPAHQAIPETDFEMPRSFRKNTLLLASYSLTEIETLPEAWFDCEALAFIEPSTQDDGRALMRHRQTLIDRGYEIWAPCTHMAACPLLTQSEKDWCHDRVHWQSPAWMTEIEKHLPMKNRTITYSYLLARKKIAPAELTDLARLTGDMMIEKGKTRQSVCRGSEREFLAWFPQRLTREVAAGFDFQRGSLVELATDLQGKSNEVRLTRGGDLRELLPKSPLG